MSVRVAMSDHGVRVIVDGPSGGVDVVLPEALASGFAAALRDALPDPAEGAEAREVGVGEGGRPARSADGDGGLRVSTPAPGPDPARPWSLPLPGEEVAEAARQAALALVRPMLGGLPETAEIEALGAPTFRVATRSFAVIEDAEGCPVLRVKVSQVEQARRLRDDRYRTDVETGPHGWTSLRLDRLDDEELRSLVLAGYRFVAPDHLAVDEGS